MRLLNAHACAAAAAHLSATAEAATEARPRSTRSASSLLITGSGERRKAKTVPATNHVAHLPARSSAMAPRRIAAVPMPSGIAPSVPRGLVVLRVVAGAARGAAPFLGCVALQVLAPRPWPLLRFAAVLAHRGLRRHLAGDGAVASVVALPAAALEPLSRPALFFIVVPPLLSIVAPPLVRTAIFYRHMLPVIAGYMQTLLLDAPGALRRSGEDAAQAVWDARHEWGSERIYAMLTELSGFYEKVSVSSPREQPEQHAKRSTQLRACALPRSPTFLAGALPDAPPHCGCTGGSSVRHQGGSAPRGLSSSAARSL